VASYADYPFKETESDLDRLRIKLKPQIDKILDPINGQRASAISTLSLGEFIEKSYFPRCRQQLPPGNELHPEPTTTQGYEDIWNVHVKNASVAKIPLRNFTAKSGQEFLESLPQHLSHQTHQRIESFLSGVFSWAINSEALPGPNPMEHTKAGGQRKKNRIVQGLSIREQKVRASNEHAYTLEEVADMIKKLPEPARTVCAVAAFTGLTRSELRGLKWTDYDGKEMHVQRKIVGPHEGPTKTEERETSIFVVPLVREILAKYKKQFPPAGDGWIFRGNKLYRPLDLDNLSRRDIPQHINGAWFGWHAFRRGTGTRLYEADVRDKDVQMILRHADIRTSMAYYIKPDKQRGERGLLKLNKTVREEYGIKA
jgi:integrase